MILQLLAWTLTVGGGFVVLFNGGSILVNARNVRHGVDRGVSMVPLVGPLLMSLGIGLVRARVDGWLVLPWLLDAGSWSIVAAIVFTLRRKSSGQR